MADILLLLSYLLIDVMFCYIRVISYSFYTDHE